MATTSGVKTKKYYYFIGIDVSRNHLDYAVMSGTTLLFHKTTKNDVNAISTFLSELKNVTGFKMFKAIFCMEQTGIYCNHLLDCLRKKKATVVVENALRIKNSLGLIRGKNDRLDSIRIAQYAQKNTDALKIWVPKRPVLIQLANLVSIRNRLVGLQKRIKMPLKEQTFFEKKTIHTKTFDLCNRSIVGIKLDLIDVKSSMESLIDSDERLKRLIKLITSVPWIGFITGVQFIISTNEFLDINDPKKFACYAGVAPFVKESGMFKGKGRVSHIASKKVKGLLHICAVASLRCNGELKDYFIRKTANGGKHKMSVLNVIRYKLILRVFACVNQNRLFIKDYGVTSPVT